MASGYAVQPDIEIHVEQILGELVIEGRQENEIRARGDDPNVHIDEDGHRAVISCNGDCRLRVPTSARLTVGSVAGDARITDVSGEIDIAAIGADLVVRDSGSVRINTVGADLELKRISGNVEVNTVGADATFREIAAELQVERIGADALVADVGASCKIEAIGADLVLNSRFAPGADYRFGNVGADVLVKIRAGADVRFVVPKGCEKSIEVSGIRIEKGDDNETLILGKGSASVAIDHIGAELILVVRDEEFEDMPIENIIPDNLDEFISEQINSHVEHIRRQAEKAAENVRKKAEREAEKARRQAEHMRRQAEHMRREAERHAERAQRHGRQGGRGGWGFEFSWPGGPRRGPIPPIPPIPPMPPHWPHFEEEKRKREAAPSEPVSNEERMSILRMVENKQITVEEAERLLAALEGLD